MDRSVRRLRTQLRGYAKAEVDAFLDRCATVPGVSLPDRGGRPTVGLAPTADEVRDVTFPRALRGYSMTDVDTLLDAVADEITRSYRRPPP